MCRVQNSLSRSLKSTLAKHRLLELHQLLLPNTIQKYFIKYDPEIKTVQDNLYLNSILKSDKTAKNSISQGKVNNHYSYYTNSLYAMVVVQTSATQSDIWFGNSPRDGNNGSFQNIYTDQLPFLQYFDQIFDVRHPISPIHSFHQYHNHATKYLHDRFQTPRSILWSPSPEEENLNRFNTKHYRLGYATDTCKLSGLLICRMKSGLCIMSLNWGFWFNIVRSCGCIFIICTLHTQDSITTHLPLHAMFSLPTSYCH